MDDVERWVVENWADDLTVAAWWARLADARLSAPMLPDHAFGRGWDRDQVRLFVVALSAVGAIGPPTGLGALMGAPVVGDFGSEEQVQRLLPPLLTGQESWCQLFSEPGAGSDLAGLTTRAVRDGDEWVVTGQKVWTSGAEGSQRGMLVARSDVDVPKHRGLTYFIVEMDQPGVQVRPLRQMNGASHFSEVFLDAARVHDRDRISEPGNGWAVTVATLGYERRGLSAADGLAAPRPAAGDPSVLDRRVADVLADGVRRDDTSTWTSYAKMLMLAREGGRVADPVVRQRLAGVHTRERLASWTQARAAAAARTGRPPGPEASIAKLAWTEGLREIRDLSMELMGAHGLLARSDAPHQGAMHGTVLSIPSASIAGGSDEIQRNIIAERSLGLPKDEQVDRDMPFRDVLTNRTSR